MRNLLLILLTLFCAQAQAAATSCGPAARSSQKLAKSTRLWRVGGSLVYELSGGLGLTVGASTPTLAFQTPDETLLAAYDAAAGEPSTALLVTRQSRGFAIYAFSPTTPSLTPLVSHKLSFTENGNTAISPLVDVVADSGYFYLLSAFHLTVLKRADVRAGTFNPVTERIPGCTTFSPDCWRNSALFIKSEGLCVAQMSHATGSQVRASYVRPLGAGGATWAPDSELRPIRASRYVNVLRTRNSADYANVQALTWMTDNQPSLLWGNNTLPMPLDTTAYATDVSLSGTDGQGLTGTVTYQTGSTYYYSGGTNVCKAFDGARSVVAYESATTTTITGIDPDGHLLTVTRQK